MNIDDCEFHQCEFGECTDAINNYTCACFSGYEGRFCEINIDDCYEVICANGAVCEDLIGKVSELFFDNNPNKTDLNAFARKDFKEFSAKKTSTIASTLIATVDNV